MDKLIIFDWGGVVESHKDGEYNVFNAQKDTIQHFRNDLTDEEIKKGYQRIAGHPHVQNVGKYNNIELVEEWFKVLKNEFSLECNFKEFLKIYLKIYDKIHYYKEVVEYAHSLKGKCKIAILSNLMYIDKNRINKQFNLCKFDHVWLSFEKKSRKPEEKIYEIVEKESDISPENILFIDDLERNLTIPIKRGWNTCQAFGYELDKIKKAVNEFIDK